ncbi:ATP-binding protein [Microbacterium sp. BK668]|uniref:ATP-binding protein n=1 Tax=Microbacterium sp. BK668 TaxID=2512118 RepID=UPI00105EB4E3|nr:ATP-binding protein [Microbacterium sp. BK668]TDN93249.1 histidine kinase/DNA gyrase B/HSP90-like ATPase [Microbacterium sp. BK668]
MAKRPSPRAIRLGMILLPSVITLALLTGTVVLALSLQERSIRDATAERVQGVASSIAALPQVRSTLEAQVDAGTPSGLADADDLRAATATLQPIADLVGQSAGVYYVVITDDEGVRITHPVPSERGVKVSTTNESVLAGTPFLGTETGTLGRSLRAKVPVWSDEGDVVGMVSVGILESDIEAERTEALGGLLPWAAGALVVAVLASSLVTAVVQRRFRRLDEVAAEQAQMQRTTAALQEQAHEFHTRLHVVHGLVAGGASRDALDYIEDLVAVGDADSDRGAGAHGAGGLREATMHAVRAELLEHGALAEFDFGSAVEFDDDVVSVLTNLSRNAAEAGASRVRCTLHVADERLLGAVDDDGPGIDGQTASRIFSRGFTSKPDASGRGRGIGLDLVRRIVSARGGAIEVGASPLGGARFSFEMAARR